MFPEQLHGLGKIVGRISRGNVETTPVAIPCVSFAYDAFEPNHLFRNLFKTNSFR